MASEQSRFGSVSFGSVPPPPKNVRRPDNRAVPVLTQFHRDQVVNLAASAPGMPPMGNFDGPRAELATTGQRDKNPGAGAIMSSAAARGQAQMRQEHIRPMPMPMDEEDLESPRDYSPPKQSRRQLPRLGFGSEGLMPQFEEPTIERRSVSDEILDNEVLSQVIPRAVMLVRGEGRKAGGDPAAFLVASKRFADAEYAKTLRLEDPSEIAKILPSIIEALSAFYGVVQAWEERDGDPEFNLND